ncbi:outer membrane lipoprotein-sorting protein [Vibrio sp. 10N.261.46.E11]|uniref:outer membrane lipoprotein-sorting protein n=1 Tax=Vibrio sp. 10N.261.46.E11 TaxID=3229662 RepID=UPI003551EB13
MKLKQSKTVLLMAITTCLSTFSNIAISDDTSEYSLNAEEVMNLSREYQRGLTNSMSTVTMTIKTRDSQIVRIMEQYILESDNAGNKTINVFSQPTDVKGVSVLTHTAMDGNDQQWLFLPSINRTKRISSSNRDSSFVGSDFAFEDLSSLELSKYKFEKASTVEVSGQKLIKVAYKPKYNGSGYSRIETYLDGSNYQPKFNKYFNSRGEHSKTLHLSDYVSYSEGGAWRPHVLKMEDHIKNSETEIVFEEFTTDSTNKSSFRPNSFNRVQ